MPCCKETALKADALKASAAEFGFDPGWIADILQKYGPDVLALAVEAVRNGLSVSLVIEIVQKFGPGLLQFIVNWLQSKSFKKLGASGSSVVVNGPVIPGVDTSLIDIIIQQYLPVIMQQLMANVDWQTVIQAVIQAIINNIHINPTPTPTPTPTNK
jgi:hypothetical protein